MGKYREDGDIVKKAENGNSHLEKFLSGEKIF